jgi:PAS domain S-box-containing protein
MNVELNHIASSLSPSQDPLGRVRAIVSELLSRNESADLQEELVAAMEELEAELEDRRRQASLPLFFDGSLRDIELGSLRYHELFNFAVDGYVVTDLNGIIRDANYAAAAMLRANKTFLVDKPLGLFVAPQQRSAFYSWLTRARLDDGAALREWRIEMQPIRGGPINVRATAGIIPGVAWPRMVRWLLRDMANLHEAERALRDERHFADSLLGIAQALVLVLDERGRILRTNAFLCGMVGRNEKELRGSDWCSLLPPEERKSAQLLIEAALQLGASNLNTGQIMSGSGERRFVAWSAKSLAAEPTAKLAVLVVGHDITDLHEAQEHALQAERLAAIGQLTTAMAHEGRNALQRMQGAVERLSWTLGEQPEAAQTISRLRAAHHDLARLFDDIRTYGGPLQLETGPCQLAEVWREAWEQALAAVRGKIALLAEDCGELDVWCSGDRFRLVQVFRNILENALAAAPDPAHIDVVCREANLDGGPALRVAIRDNGPGLGAEQRQRIFEAFYTTKARGTGLGMAIARRIVEAHGGNIAVGDIPGCGAEIVLTLPRAQP